MHSSDPQVDPLGSSRCAVRRRPRPRHASPSLGACRARSRAADEHGQGRDHRRRDARHDGEVPRTPTRSTPRRSSTPRTSSRSTARTRRGQRSRPRPPAPTIVIYMGHGNGWPSPYTYDPELHDEGWLRAERRRRPGRLQQQVLRRALHPHARPRPERDRLPQPPVLRVGQLGAGRGSNPTLSVAQQRVDNYGAGFLAAGARPSSRMAIATAATTCGLCSRQPSRSLSCGAGPRTITATTSRSRRHEAPGPPSSTPTTVAEPRRATTARSSATST